MKVAGMGQGGHRRGSAPMAEINIIPLVDITLVLLIIFMATTAFVKDQNQQDKNEETLPQIPLQLPQSGAAVDAPVADDTLVLGIDKEGRKFVDNAAVTTEALHQRVREAALKNPNGRVRIDADRDTRFQDIVEVIELAQFEGMRNVGLHIAKDEQP
jgi:biopolymer transport protein ExbD